MDKINVVWLSYHKPEILSRGYWDQGLLEEIISKLSMEAVHHDGFENFSPEGEGYDHQGAIVVINGRTHIEDTDKINQDIARLRWCLFIETGDEEAQFPWREIKHPIMRVWMMLPRMNQHDDTHFKLPQGYRPSTMEVLKDIGKQERIQDWFFAGQVNHDRREQCIAELRYLVASGENPRGSIIVTDGFGDEKISYEEYLKHMAMSKIVLCPSGIETPDSFRFYEALEAGCLPVVDQFSTKNQSPGFWKYLFGDDLHFPFLSYWDKLPALMPELIRTWPERSAKCFAWWQQKKRSMVYQLEDDIKELAK
jgi:hypothetical protein